jgi:uncharacterized protein
MLAGAQGRARQWALRHQIEVGGFFDAPDVVSANACREPLGLSANAGPYRGLHRICGVGSDRLMPTVLKCHRGLGPSVTGVALVADDNFSARYDLERAKGTFSRPTHKLYGQSYVDRILVLVTAKGGVASAWMLREMAARGMAPKAIIFNRANTILARGAAFAVMTLVDRFAGGNPTRLIRTGDELRVEPGKGLVTILNRD